MCYGYNEFDRGNINQLLQQQKLYSTYKKVFVNITNLSINITEDISVHVHSTFCWKNVIFCHGCTIFIRYSNENKFVAIAKVCLGYVNMTYSFFDVLEDIQGVLKQISTPSRVIQFSRYRRQENYFIVSKSAELTHMRSFLLVNLLAFVIKVCGLGYVQPQLIKSTKTIDA